MSKCVSKEPKDMTAECGLDLGQVIPMTRTTYLRPYFTGQGEGPVQCRMIDMQPLKSLGELCLEVVEETRLAHSQGRKNDQHFIQLADWSPLFITHSDDEGFILIITKPEDALALRRAMWHQKRPGEWMPTYGQAFQFARIVEKARRDAQT